MSSWQNHSRVDLARTNWDEFDRR